MSAAAGVPAPIVYVKNLAVKKLVVGVLLRANGPPFGRVSGLALASSWRTYLPLTVWKRYRLPTFALGEFLLYQCHTRVDELSL